MDRPHRQLFPAKRHETGIQKTYHQKGDNDETVSKHYSVAGAYNTFTYKVGLILK